MTLHPTPSEFPFISGQFSFLFYQCTIHRHIALNASAAGFLGWVCNCVCIPHGQQMVNKVNNSELSRAYFWFSNRKIYIMIMGQIVCNTCSFVLLTISQNTVLDYYRKNAVYWMTLDYKASFFPDSLAHLSYKKAGLNNPEYYSMSIPTLHFEDAKKHLLPIRKNSVDILLGYSMYRKKCSLLNDFQTIWTRRQPVFPTLLHTWVTRRQDWSIQNILCQLRHFISRTEKTIYE